MDAEIFEFDWSAMMLRTLPLVILYLIGWGLPLIVILVVLSRPGVLSLLGLLLFWPYAECIGVVHIVGDRIKNTDKEIIIPTTRIAVKILGVYFPSLLQCTTFLSMQ